MYALVRRVSDPYLCTISIFSGPTEMLGSIFLEREPDDAHGFQIAWPLAYEQMLTLLIDIHQIKPNHEILEMLRAHATNAWRKGSGIEPATPAPLHLKTQQKLRELMDKVDIGSVYEQTMQAMESGIEIQARRFKAS